MRNYELVPITKEELDKLEAYERSQVLQAYHEWLVKQRKTDRKYANMMNRKIENFKTRDQRKIWRENNKEKVRKINIKWRRNKYIKLYGVPPEVVKKIKVWFKYGPEYKERKRKADNKKSRKWRKKNPDKVKKYNENSKKKHENKKTNKV